MSFLEEIPAFTPPVSSLLPSGAGVQGTDEGSLSFGGANIPVTGATTSESNSAGGANNGAAGDESASISAGGTAVFNNETEYVQSGFAQGNESTSTPITNPNLLWGAVATAALGATLADWQRKREEEEARKRAEAPAPEKKGGGGKKTPGQRAYEKKMKQKRIVGESQALLNKKAEQQAASQRARDDYRAGEKAYDIAQAKAIQQQARDDYRAGERAYAVQQAEKAELQAGLSAYYDGRKKGEEKQEVASPIPTRSATPTASQTPSPSKTPTPWIQTSTPLPATNMPVASPTAIATPTSVVAEVTSQPKTNKTWWVPSFVENAARELLSTLPDTTMISHRQETPVFGFMTPGGILSFGHVTEISAGTQTSTFKKGDVNVAVNPEGFKVDTNGNPSLSSKVKPNGFEMGVKVNSPVKVEENAYSGSLGYSAGISFDWSGNSTASSIWNSTLTFDLNHVDVDVSTGTDGVTKGNVSDGTYVKFKPVQVVTVAVVAIPLIVFAPEIGAAIAALGAATSQLVPQFVR